MHLFSSGSGLMPTRLSVKKRTTAIPLHFVYLIVGYPNSFAQYAPYSDCILSILTAPVGTSEKIQSLLRVHWNDRSEVAPATNSSHNMSSLEDAWLLSPGGRVGKGVNPFLGTR